MHKNIPPSAQGAIKLIEALNAADHSDYGAYAAGLDAATDKLKALIVHSPSEYDIQKPTFYISPNGNDNSDGRTPQTAWQTFKNINDPQKTCEGCNILFERGGIFRGSISIPHSGMTFSAYGVGIKPRLYGSLRNYANPAYWKKSPYENVWYTDICTKNVGLIAINHSDVAGNYNEIMCRRHHIGRDNFTGPQDLKNEYDFYGHIDEEICYLYCPHGNPGKVYQSIELGEGFTLIQPSGGAVRDLAFDNLCIKFVGCHAIAGLHCRENVTVKNCVFCYLGGSILDGHAGGRITGYGNAVETCSCRGYYIYGNWMYQIYDTAITHQCGAGKHPSFMEDIRYVGNLCEYCHWSIEFYNLPCEGVERYSRDTYIHHNILRHGGYGWGSEGRKEGAALFNSFGMSPDTKNFTAHDNIFDRSAGGIVRYNEGGDQKIGMFGNVYIQSENGDLGWILDSHKPFKEAEKHISGLLHEERPQIFLAK